MRLFALLLRLYPTWFRIEYGSELIRLCSARRRTVGGGLAVVVFWLGEISDLLASAGRVHWDTLRQDLGTASRGLRRAPGFAATAVLVTALGVGANAAVFSITDRVLIRPLPFEDPNRLVRLWETGPEGGYNELSPANFRDWKRMSTSFQHLAAYSRVSVNLVGEGEPQRLEAAMVTPELLPMLGVAPELGRLFSAEDDREGAPGTLVLGHGLWQSQFGGAPDVLGRSVRLDGESFVVVGVMPAAFSFPSRQVQLWTPYRFRAENFEERDDTWLNLVARLAPGATLKSARAEMQLVTEQLEREYPNENAKTRARLRLLHDEVSEQSRLLLAALSGASLCVLLLACSNLAGLLLARGIRRRQELSIRAVLGAGRERLVRQLLTESLVLAGLGGALGVLLAATLTPLLARLVPTTLPLDGTLAVDLRVLGFAAALSLLTGIGFGVLPSLRTCAGAGTDRLREGTRGELGRRPERLRLALVAAQVASSVVLVIAAGLLLRALWRVQAVDPGFRAEGVLTLRTPLPRPKYEPTAVRARLYETVVSEARALPGVTQAAFISFLPMVMRGGIWSVGLDGAAPDPKEPRSVSLRFVTPGFFDALRIPLRRGRDVAAQDGPDSPLVAVVSASFVKDHWPGQDPIGRQIEVAFFSRTVVGVVGDVRVRGLEGSSEPQVYLPYRQVPDGGLINYAPKDLVIRTSADPAGLAAAVRAIVRKADPELPVSNIRLLSAVVAEETAPRRAQVWVLGVFAAVSLLLAGLGIYGLLSYAVSQRIPEIGLRVALGAPRSSILRMVLADGVSLAVRGAVLGLGLAYAAGRSMQALLAGVSPGDVSTFVAGASLALLMTVSGSLIPTLRALRVEPTVALRADP